MPVVLTIVDGPGAGSRYIVRNGQEARVGSTDLADFCVANDDSMAGVQFSVRFDSEACTLRRLDGAAATLLNDREIDAEATLRDGDTIAAGASRFAVAIEGEIRLSAVKPRVLGDDDDTEGAGGLVNRIASVAEQSALSGEARSLVVGQSSPDDALAALTAASLRDDAIALLAHWLAPRERVWWTWLCAAAVLGESHSAGQQAALDAAKAWVADSSDEHRLAALRASSVAESGPVADWIARCAVWNSNNLSQEGLPQVPPPPGLGSKAVIAALRIAAAATTPPARPEVRYDNFLRIGRSLLLGETELPQA